MAGRARHRQQLIILPFEISQVLPHPFVSPGSDGCRPPRTAAAAAARRAAVSGHPCGAKAADSSPASLRSSGMASAPSPHAAPTSSVSASSRTGLSLPGVSRGRGAIRRRPDAIASTRRKAEARALRRGGARSAAVRFLKYLLAPLPPPPPPPRGRSRRSVASASRSLVGGTPRRYGSAGRTARVTRAAVLPE